MSAMAEPAAPGNASALRSNSAIAATRSSSALAAGAPAPVALGEHIVEAARVPQRHRGALLKLTPMELTVIRFLGWGRSNGDIATLLLISENTVRVHLSNVCRKLELDGMRELAALAGLLFYPSD